MTSLTVRWHASRRAVIAEVADRLAWFTFAVLIVISPLAARITLARHPIERVNPANSDFLLPYSSVAILGILGLWAVSVVARPRRLDPGPAFVWVPAVGLLAVATVGIPFSVDPSLTAYNVFRLLLMVGIGAYVINEVAGPERLVVPLMLMIGIEAAVGIGQAALQRSVGLTWLSEIRSAVNAAGASVIGAADGSRWLRAYGLTSHANILGGVLAFGLILLAGVQGETRRSRLARLAIYGLGVVGLFLTFSRGAWIGFAVGLLAALVLLAGRGDRAGVRRWAAAAVTAAAIAGVLAVPFAAQLAARTTLAGPVATETRSIDERIAQARITLDVIASHPITGTGLGMLTLVFPDSAPDFEFSYAPAHLVVLDAAAETGVVGLLFYLGLIVAPWVALARMRSRWTQTLAWTSAALAAVTVVGLFDFYTWAPSAGRTWAWLILGLWVVAYRSAQGTARSESDR